MKKYFLLVQLFFISIVSVKACDLCGCFMGITPYDNQSSFGIYHRYRCFNAYEGQTPSLFPKSILTSPIDEPQLPGLKHGNHGTNPTQSESDYEIFSVVELRAKYFIHKRIELNGILPYNMNRTKKNDTLTNLKAVGDINLFAGFHLIRPDEYKKIQQRLIIGAGIKLATGHYYIGYDEGNRYELLNQPGTGSNDLMTYVNYVFGFRKWGLSTNLSYRMNGTNYFQEKIGNSFTNFTNVFYKFKVGNFIMIPSVQMYYEYTPGLYLNEIYQENTRMNVLMLGPGFDFYYKNIGFNSNFQLTLAEELYSTNVQSVCKLMVGISYNFNQKKYALGNKKKKNETPAE